MGFFSFLVLLAIAYLLWRVTDQLPDLIFRLSEVQRDVAELRRAQSEQSGDNTGGRAAAAPATPAAPVSKPESEPAAETTAGGDGD
jgi:hypothetical protein